MLESDQRWTLLRDITGAPPANDPDFTDPANAAAAAAAGWQSVPGRTENVKLAFFAVAYDGSGVVLARGTAALELVVYQEVQRQHGFKDVTIPTAIISSDPVATTLQEKVVIDAGSIDRFTIGVQQQATMPATIERIRVFWRME